MLKPKKSKGDLTGTSKSEKKARMMKLNGANNTASSRASEIQRANSGDRQDVAFKARPSTGVGSKPSNSPDEVLDPKVTSPTIKKPMKSIAKYSKGSKSMNLKK